jgi:hypothetical protein
MELIMKKPKSRSKYTWVCTQGISVLNASESEEKELNEFDYFETEEEEEEEEEEEFELFDDDDTDKKQKEDMIEVNYNKMYYCVKVSLLMYAQPDVRSALGLVLKKEINEKDQVLCFDHVKAYTLENGILGEIKITFRLMEGSSEFVQWGKLHRSSLLYNMNIDKNKLRDRLLPIVWTIGPNSSRYQIVPDSMVEKKFKRKRTT